MWRVSPLFSWQTSTMAWRPVPAGRARYPSSRTPSPGNSAIPATIEGSFGATSGAELAGALPAGATCARASSICAAREAPLLVVLDRFLHQIALQLVHDRKSP